MTIVKTIASRIRLTVIYLLRSHRFLAFEVTARFASTVFGRAGNDWGAGACPSIRFKALRMELNGILLQAAQSYCLNIFRLGGQVGHFKYLFFSIENNFSQWSYKPIHRKAVFGLHPLDGITRPGIVFIVDFDIAIAQIL